MLVCESKCMSSTHHGSHRCRYLRPLTTFMINGLSGDFRSGRHGSSRRKAGISIRSSPISICSLTCLGTRLRVQQATDTSTISACQSLWSPSTSRQCWSTTMICCRTSFAMRCDPACCMQATSARRMLSGERPLGRSSAGSSFGLSLVAVWLSSSETKWL